MKIPGPYGDGVGMVGGTAKSHREWCFAFQLSHPGLTPEQRAKIEAERDGYRRLDPLYIGEMIPGYQRPRPPAEKMIAKAIEKAMREQPPEWEIQVPLHIVRYTLRQRILAAPPELRAELEAARDEIDRIPSRQA